MANNTNVRIGDVLIDKGYISQAQLDEALAFQKQHRDMRIGQILMENGYVSEKQVLEALAERLNLEIVDVSRINVDNAAIARVDKTLAERNLILPVRVRDQALTIVTNDPLNYFALEEVRQQSGCYLEILLGEAGPISRAISYYYTEVSAKNAARQANVSFTVADDDDLEIEDLDTSDDEAPIIRLLNSLLSRAVKSNASDIHIEPFERETKIRMRIDGVMMDYVMIQRNIHPSLIARVKILANLDIAEKRLPQDGHFRVGVDESYVNVRVSILPTVFGEKAVLRLLSNTGELEYPDQFGMDEFSYNRFLEILNRPNGIIYMTGPTGSGKSTTLYMVLEYLLRRNVNISTIEDPVEKNIYGINQTQVNTVSGLTFGVGLNALMRQDPDIIMVGETRDNETASTSVRAAITGHLVLSTLHTNDAASSIVRLEDMGVETYLVGNSLIGLVAQRLVRKNCPYCSIQAPLSDHERAFLGDESITYVYRGSGCPRCNNTGYRGRIAIHEILNVDNEIRKMIIRNATIEEITNYAVQKQGMRTLKMSGLILVKQGITTPEELMKVSYE